MRAYRTIRTKRFHEQNGRCHYCRQPMWLSDMPSFARQYNLTARQARQMQATAEHLDPLGTGGADEPANIVAACAFCNNRRHRHRPHAALAPEAFARHVRARLARGGWHGLRLVAT